MNVSEDLKCLKLYPLLLTPSIRAGKYEGWEVRVRLGGEGEAGGEDEGW